MNFDSRIKELENRSEAISKSLITIKNQLEEARTFTAAFLDKCSKIGYTAVAIDRVHRSIPQSESFPFGPSGSVFAHKMRAKDKNQPRINGWPAIWRIIEEMDLKSGAGNSHQMQTNTAQLIEGVYHFKSGNWIRIKDS